MLVANLPFIRNWSNLISNNPVKTKAASAITSKDGSVPILNYILESLLPIPEKAPQGGGVTALFYYARVSKS